MKNRNLGKKRENSSRLCQFVLTHAIIVLWWIKIKTEWNKKNINFFIKKWFFFDVKKTNQDFPTCSVDLKFVIWCVREKEKKKKVLKFLKEKGQIMWDWEKMVLSLRQFWLFPYLFHPLSQGKLIACFFVSPLSLKQDYRENYLTPWWKMCVK